MKILLSARDPAAAQVILNLVEYLHTKEIVPTVLASGAACSMLENLDCKFCCYDEPENGSVNLDLLREFVRNALDNIQPDVIIAGSSGPDAGIDEVLIEQSGNIRTYVVQDFWGDVNTRLDVYPDCYLVLDSYAAKLTSQRVSSEVFEVGSVKHDKYYTMDCDSVRKNSRKKLQVGVPQTIVGFYGMPLSEFGGYFKTINELAGALPETVKVLYRPHPKENVDSIAKTKEAFSDYDFYFDESLTLEESLLACDLVISCYSSCGIDSELLHRSANQSSTVSIFMLQNEEIYENYRSYSKLDDVPLSIQNRSISIFDSAILSDVISKYLVEKNRAEFLSGAEKDITEVCASQNVIDKVNVDFYKTTIV